MCWMAMTFTLQIALKESLEVLEPASEDESIVSEEVLFIKIALGSADKVVHTLLFEPPRSLYCLRDQHIVGSSTPCCSTIRSVFL